ncbi:hypothetical protein FH972_025440 [Carpinus fangiana]|uniref:Transcription factor domain-containing protein n=1 Tax=Carpinus fangiana TaxID=176857 RepID=A0A5N6L220_9ROSI|nr:hypothetical protein FH972_025440 [Carpinus fangiana]
MRDEELSNIARSAYVGSAQPTPQALSSSIERHRPEHQCSWRSGATPIWEQEDDHRPPLPPLSQRANKKTKRKNHLLTHLSPSFSPWLLSQPQRTLADAGSDLITHPLPPARPPRVASQRCPHQEQAPLVAATQSLARDARRAKGATFAVTRHSRNGKCRHPCHQRQHLAKPTPSRNCTKHQCRCDYMDAPPPADEPVGQSPIPGLFWSPEIEAIVDGWERAGEARLGPFSIDLRAEGHRYSHADLHLIYFMLVSGQSPETREFTVWTSTTAHRRRTLAAARSKPFLVHAILAFSALSLAWENNATDVKAIAYHHAGIALEGLQRATASFCRENSDAVLLASVLLSWQANDYRGWVSLTQGIRTVVKSMQSFKHESSICHVVDEQEAAIPESFGSVSRLPVDDEFHNNYVLSLQQMISALEGLEPYNAGRQELDWFSQLKDYLSQLMEARPADTPQEQFNHLYHFRKFLFWIPSSALKSRTRDYSTLLSLSYLYSIALQMEPLFPNVAAAFCSRMVLQPLHEIFTAFDNLQQTSMPGDEQVQNMLMLLQYPRQIVNTYYSARQMRDATIQSMRRTPPGFDAFSGDLAYSIEAQNAGMPQRSPAFGPAPTRSASVHSHHSVASSHRGSPYLELPETMQAQQLPTSDLDMTPPQQHDLRYGSAPVQDRHYSVQPDNRFNSVGPTSGIMTLSLPSMPSLEVEAPTPIDPQVSHPFGMGGLGLSLGNRLSADAATLGGGSAVTYSHTRAGSEGFVAPQLLWV